MSATSDVAAPGPVEAREPKSISVSLSGGGHRAALFALGALLYLADAGKNRAVTSIASVSGGSLTNGHLAQTLDCTIASPEDELAAWAAVPAKRFSLSGTLWAAPVTWLYLVALAIVTGAATLGVWWLPFPAWARALLFVGGVLVAGFVAQQRGKGLRTGLRAHALHSEREAAADEAPREPFDARPHDLRDRPPRGRASVLLGPVHVRIPLRVRSPGQPAPAHGGAGIGRLSRRLFGYPLLPIPAAARFKELVSSELALRWADRRVADGGERARPPKPR